MTTLVTSNTSKSNYFSLSQQVKDILHDRGYSKLFNYADYQFYKKQVKHNFNKAQAIAELFILDNESELSDFEEYIF